MTSQSVLAMFFFVAIIHNTAISMDIDQSIETKEIDNFSILLADKLNNLRTLEFRRITISALSKEDENSLMQLADFAGFKEHFNSFPLALRLVSYSEFKPQKMLQIFQQYRNNCEGQLNEKDLKGVHYDWIIEEASELGKKKILGYLSMIKDTKSLIWLIPPHDRVAFEIFCWLHKDYRKKGLASLAMNKILKHLSSHKDFKDAYYFGKIEVNDNDMRIIAEKLGFKKITEKPIKATADFIDFKEENELHFYGI